MKGQAKQGESSVTADFLFKFGAKSCDADYELKVPVTIPFSGIVVELTQRLLSSLKLPCYIENDLASALDEFLKNQTQKYRDELADKLVDEGRSSGVAELEDIVRQWEAAFKGVGPAGDTPSSALSHNQLHASMDNEVIQFCGPVALSDEELFAEAYHRLVHSPLLDRVLAGEQALSTQVVTLVARRDEEIKQLTHRQAEEMQSALEGKPEEEVSALAQSHWEARELLQGEWESRLDALRATQRRQARAWLMALSQQQQTAATDAALPESPVSPWPSMDLASATPVENAEPSHQPPLLEESFTIHLGSQMKQMHNIRLMACDVLSLCQFRGQPQKQHTSLSLYSNELHGLVLFTDCQPPASSRMSAGFQAVCQEATEIHFMPVEQQLEAVAKQAMCAASWRELQSSTGDAQAKSKSGKLSLRSGDCYITKHSSLAEVHVVFHLLSDDSLLSGDVSSRHPIILGLRNILKTASAYDVTCLSIPLLLVHEMSEEMTVAWCARRAELVFKCIKGFMIETASWGGSELKTLQFILPKGISEDLFGNLATILPSIFRVANPLIFKAK